MNYQITTDKFMDIRGIPIIILKLSYDNNIRYRLVFYKNDNNDYVCENSLKLDKYIEYLMDNNLITLSLPVYEYTKFCLKLTPKAVEYAALLPSTVASSNS